MNNDALDFKDIESALVNSLGLTRRPVAISFTDEPIPGVARFTGSEPSNCSYWRLAAEGKTFYTVPADHYNCAVGSHTHNISLPKEREKELSDTIGFMAGIGYIKMEEVGKIPQLPFKPRVLNYSPLSDARKTPDVVMLIGKPGKLMLAYEAAIRAGVAAQMPSLGRPTCMSVPAAMSSGAVTSTGCVGNRVYTGLSDDELYLAIPGKDLGKVVGELNTIVDANAQLLEYHRGRRASLATE